MPYLPHLKSFLLANVLTALTLSPAWAKEEFKAVTTFTMIADMASNITGDAADVSSITKPGAEIREYQPTPGDIKRAQGTQLILSNDLDLELWSPRFYRDSSSVPGMMVSNGMRPMGIGEGLYDGKPNPHVWMSAENVLVYVDNIRDALIKYDPGNAATYQNNARNYKAKIQQALVPLHTKLAKLPADERWLVTSEGAFSYLTHDNSLKELYLWPINTDQQDTPKRVRKVIDATREHHTPTILSESTVFDRPARQVARESGTYYGGVLYIDSLSVADGPVPTYLDLLHVAAQTIANGINRGLESQP